MLLSSRKRAPTHDHSILVVSAVGELYGVYTLVALSAAEKFGKLVS